MRFDPGASALLTDLYQLTMIQAYLREGLTDTAVFELFVRRLPERRNFLLAAGLAQALEYLEDLRFSPAELEWLSESGLFDRATIDGLERLRFNGDVDALPEGTVFFADEPLLRVTAPLPQAQLVETRLLNILNFQSAIASKAARCVLAARGRRLVEYGLRRAHGAEAGLWAARAAYLAGFDGSSAALAAPLYGVPVSGTMAHSFVEAHDDEAAAFEAFARANPGGAILLLDTYDVDEAAEAAAVVGARLRREGLPLLGVRLDSGDLAAQARRVRLELDAARLESARIFASGGLDEWAIRDLLAAGAPIDGFGVGTLLSTSADAPFLDAAYKLQEYGGRPRRKLSAGKETWPGRKQVRRRRADDGTLVEDVVALESEPVSGTPLLRPAMRAGRRLVQPGLEASRRHSRRQLESLPEPLRALETAPPYRVRVSIGLRELAESLERERKASRLSS